MYIGILLRQGRQVTGLVSDSMFGCAAMVEGAKWKGVESAANAWQSHCTPGQRRKIAARV